MIKYRILRWAEREARMEEGRNDFGTSTCKLIGEKALGRLRHEWKDAIRMNLKVIGVNTRNWFNSTQERDY